MDSVVAMSKVVRVSGSLVAPALVGGAESAAEIARVRFLNQRALAQAVDEAAQRHEAKVRLECSMVQQYGRRVAVCTADADLDRILAQRRAL